MKSLFAVVGAVLGLAGCVAVPAYEPYPAYGPGYYYAPPAASFSFGYSHHDHSYGRRHYGGHRHGFRGRDRD